MSQSSRPAFPLMPSHTNPLNLDECFTGLTKRELFAAMAMQGFCYSGRMDFFDREFKFSKTQFETKAEMAVKCADALIDTLDANPKGVPHERPR